MKKLLICLLALTLVLPVAACSSKGGNDGGAATQTEFEDNIAGNVAKEFTAVAQGASSTDDIADKLMNSEALSDAPGFGMMPVEPGFLNGFSSEISGFAEGTQFSPMIGTIPFMGFVFKLDGSMSADDFMGQLKDNADKRWNICTEADDLATTAVGDYVVFVMAPRSFEE